MLKSSKERLDKVKNIFVHEQLNKIILLFLIALIIIFIFEKAGRENLNLVPIVVFTILQNLTVILITFGGATLFIRLTNKFFLDHMMNMAEIEEKILLSKAYIFLIYTIALIIVFIYVGIGINNIALSFGLIASGFTFAIRDVILSFIVWFMLLTKKPFKIGDYIKINDIEGQVKHIGMFYVIVNANPQTFDDYTKVPNRLFIENAIHNYGRRKFISRFDIYLKNITNDILEKLNAINENNNLVKESKAKFYLNSDKDGLKITVEFKTTYENRDKLRNELISLIINELKFENEKIDITA